MGKGLLYALPNLNEAISHPFQIQWTNNTLKSIGLCLLTYGITVGIYLSSSKNYRRNEEYGSARWANPFRVCKKYADNQSTHDNTDGIKRPADFYQLHK
jgi:type IV secretion system protein VirD4